MHARLSAGTGGGRVVAARASSGVLVLRSKPAGLRKEAGGSCGPGVRLNRGEAQICSSSSGTASQRKTTCPDVVYDQRPRLEETVRGSVVGVILGGGETDSRRLFPLTEKRTLPAIPVGGIYRLIDIPMSNLINSGVNKIYILAQYQSTSLNHYLVSAYNFQGSGIPIGGDGYMEVVAATQGPESQRWAEGSADSVRQWMESNFLGNSRNRFCTDVIILPSDQIYRVDFFKMVEEHRMRGADITVACRPVDADLVDHFGIVQMARHGTQIEAFIEKPSRATTSTLSMDWDDLDDFLRTGSTSLSGKSVGIPNKQTWIASCGIYIFKREVLEKLLSNKKNKDFGRDLLPQAVAEGYKVMAANLSGFWTDIGGSIGDYYTFSMDLVKPSASFSFNWDNTNHPIHAHPANLPPVLIEDCTVKDSMIAPGCQIYGSTIINSIIGARALVNKGCSIVESVLMGSDYFEHEKKFSKPTGPSFPHIGVGEGTIIQKAIIDKNARIGVGCTLVNKEGIEESFDRVKKGLCIRDGVIVVSKSAVIPDGTFI